MHIDSKYEEKLKTSLLEVEDLLGSFDLAPPPSKTTPTPTTTIKPLPPPASTISTSSATKEPRGFAHEVEVPLYDSDSLPSPPSSHTSSEADTQELDKLLDFTQDDEFNYNPGYAPKEPRDFTQEGLEGPRIVKAMWQAQHGIEVCVPSNLAIPGTY